MTDFTINTLTAAAGALAGSTEMEVQRSGQSGTEKTTIGKLASLMAPLRFFPLDNEPPSSNYATLDTRNNHPVLDFDDTTGESAIFTGILPLSYNGSGLTVEVAYSMTSATSGTCGWTFDLERVGDSQQDTDSDGFTGSPITITAGTVPGTSGFVTVLSANVANGATMDSIAAGEQFRIKVTRDVANDNGSGDAELHWVRIREQ